MFMKLTDATIQMSGRSGEGLRPPGNEIPPVAGIPTETPDKMDVSILSEKTVLPLRTQESAREVRINNSLHV